MVNVTRLPSTAEQCTFKVSFCLINNKGICILSTLSWAGILKKKTSSKKKKSLLKYKPI